MQVISRLCDFEDGFEAQSRQFRLDDQSYEIDVCRSHGEALDEAVKVWALKGRRPADRRVLRSADRRRHNAVVRAWGIEHAAELGVRIAPGGRIPVVVTEAYARTH